ncbi:MAG TPA: hypothetical protein VE912_09220 [Bacteroidales bacterium]|nr:hypothetical protein [Bacteroidales bacterium]
MNLKTFRVFIEDTETKKRHVLMITAETKVKAGQIADRQLRVTDLAIQRIEQAHYGK